MITFFIMFTCDKGPVFIILDEITLCRPGLEGCVVEMMASVIGGCVLKSQENIILLKRIEIVEKKYNIANVRKASFIRLLPSS